ncbi:NAD(P)-dependent oxidoreductase [Amycolatopsis aidingensis]|uniref:NAD(P)-dependent oxidoreductase n=1 Tax=Amycolatopsis aidingensis TaxID=2842453 RepID=UPI001C0BE670|nr:NAD(P)-dependent oxidoreductase [Amycolatopsis aidingensis]
MPAAQRAVGVLGLGGMGGGMATALLRAGFPVTVYNRTAAKAEALAGEGAGVAATPAEVAESAEVLLVSLADEEAVESVLFQQLDGALGRGQRVLDTSTVSPEFARTAAKRMASRGVSRIEACVVGNPRMAQDGTLRVFVSGERSEVDAVSDVLDAIGGQTQFLGEPGTASSLKLAFNLLLGVQTVGLTEAVGLAETAGLDRGLVLDTLRDMAWGSFALGFRAEFMRNRSYRPAGFRSALMHKDLRLACQEAGSAGLDLPVTQRAAERYAAMLAEGTGNLDAAGVLDHPQAPRSD